MIEKAPPESLWRGFFVRGALAFPHRAGEPQTGADG